MSYCLDLGDQEDLSNSRIVLSFIFLSFHCTKNKPKDEPYVDSDMDTLRKLEEALLNFAEYV